MRLDRFLCEVNIGTRSQVKDFVRQGLVTVNGRPAKNGDLRLDENADAVCFRGQPLFYRPFVYYMLNKPGGVVSATRDEKERTVLSLLSDCHRREDLFPVGRLDKDTTGLLLLTNDGGLAHRLLSPKRHVDKTYRARIARALSPEDIRALEIGVDIGEEKPTLPAGVEVLSECEISVTVREGKYHQIKRMLRAVDNEVLELKRTAFGGLPLDEGLAPGEYRELTQKEVCALHGT